MAKLFKAYEANFTQIPNHIINDDSISLKAKGLYIYMVSKPDNWEFSILGISSQNKDGKDAVIAAINELCNAGYLEKIKNRDFFGKQLVNDYKIFMKPVNTDRFGKTDSAKPIRLNRFGKSSTSNKEKAIPTSNIEIDEEEAAEFAEAMLKHRRLRKPEKRIAYKSAVMIALLDPDHPNHPQTHLAYKEWAKLSVVNTIPDDIFSLYEAM